MNALLDLLKEKDSEEITVNELCERALVGRGTFYKHFSDKYEFFSFVLNEMLDHYMEEAEAQSDDDDPCAYYLAFFEGFLQFMQKNNESFGPPTSRSMISVMLFSTSDSIARQLEQHLRLDQEEGRTFSIQPSSAARFLTGAMAQSARYLLGHPEEANKKQLVADMRLALEILFNG